MAALDGALALKERGHVAVLVGQHLELDVARVLDELLHVELAVAEGVGGLGGGGMEEIGQFLGGAHDAHAAPAAAGLGLENDGVADLCGPILRFFDRWRSRRRSQAGWAPWPSSSPGAPFPFRPSGA